MAEPEGTELRPSTVAIEITRRCNLACKTCFASSTPDRSLPQLSTSAVIAAIDELLDLGTQSFLLGGGEPTLHPGFLEIAEHLLRRGAVVGFSTNGTLLTGDLVNHLAACGLRNNIFVSLDGPDPSSYRLIRVSPSFDAVLAGLHRLKQAGLRFALSMVVCEPTAHLIPKMHELGRDVGAEFVNLIRFNLEGRGGQYWSQLEPKQEFAEICRPHMERWNGRMAFFGENCILPVRASLRVALPEESDLRTFVAISAEGDVCLGRASAGIRIGNLRDGGFGAVWSSAVASAYLRSGISASSFLQEIAVRRATMAEKYRAASPNANQQAATGVGPSESRDEGATPRQAVELTQQP